MLGFGAVVVAVILRLIGKPFHERFGLRPGTSLFMAVLASGAATGAASWLWVRSSPSRPAPSRN